jgi:hypothetical protein
MAHLLVKFLDGKAVYTVEGDAQTKIVDKRASQCG